MQDPWVQQAKQYYDGYAQAKQQPRRFQLFVQAYRRLVGILNLDQDTALLDVGCGCGELASAVHGSIQRYVGIDVSGDSLAVAKRHNPQAEFIQSDMTTYRSQVPFDCATAISALEFCQGKEQALRCLRDNLRCRGILYLEVRNADFLLWWVSAPLRGWLRSHGWIESYAAQGFEDLTVDQWRELVEAAGFEITAIRRAVRPAVGIGAAAWLKRVLIRSVSYVAPLRWHYMVGLVCQKP